MELFILGILIILLTDRGYGEEQRVCWYTSQTVGQLSVQQIETAPDYADDFDYGVSRIQGSNQTCPKRTNYCYALWKEDQRSPSGFVIIAQGCWESSGKQDCESNSCVTSRKPPKALNDTNFCCCQGNFCNGNVSQMYYLEEAQTDVEVEPTLVVKYEEKPYVLVLIIVLILFIIAASCSPPLILLSRRLRKKRLENENSHPDSVHLMENGKLHDSNFSVENLKLEEIIGQGKYGVVWKGSVGNQEVAVKIFQSHQRTYFFNEVDIYCVPFMAHPSLLSYFGHDECIDADGNTEYFLFLSLAPNGTVQDYLRSNVVDWNTFCKMALSIAKGVAYLHSDIRNGDKIKPCISHRDLNSKNILVKEDLSCVICDLGFATKISGSKYYYNGEEQHAEIKSINDVGTLRYMSPEVLEGAVNLRDCETSLKQIDVYALGLVLWELSSRCSDFYPSGLDCAPYRLPFEAEIGHPTFEQMQVLVCKQKARPLFPELWRDSPAVRSVKETIEDCWDQDAEARLTALCVEERFHELCGISERQKVSFYSCGLSPTARTTFIQKDCQNKEEEESYKSESTVETLLAITPANPNPKNSNHFQGICPPLQPYQGRNACLERNLMFSHECDSNSSELIDKSHKSMPNRIEPSSIVSDFLNVYPTNSSNQNYSNHNSYSNHSEPILRSNAPIPFLQNVNVDSTTIKDSNLHKTNCQPSSRKISWKNFKKIFESKRRADDVSPQIDCNVKSNLIVNENCENLTTPTASLEPKLETQVSLSNGKLETRIAAKDNSTFSEMLKLPKAEVESTMSLLGTQNNRRPNTLPIVKDTDLSNSGKSNVDKVQRDGEDFNGNQKNWDSKKRYSLGVNAKHKKDRTDKTKSLAEVEELEILRLESKVEEAFKKNINLLDLQKSLGESKVDKTNRNSIKEKNVGKEEEAEKMFLPFNSQPAECGPSKENVIAPKQNEIQLKDPNLRVKTPGDVPLAIRKLRGERNAARFSLYDDRIMSGYYDSETLCCIRKENGDHSDIFNSFENIKFSQNI